ncbi:MAG: hypothetical protein OXU77_21855 [Gammaproteobacteria bacterium]|nr:hypothetical protein [Gammaproteobacteria bacterium]
MNYYTRFMGLSNHLNKEVHPKVNAGSTAAETVWLTDHGPDHIATVIGRIHDLAFQSGAYVVSPYEAYILAVAAHMHDIGNVYGREEHERRVRDILFGLDDTLIGDDNIEKRMICDIAMAHGGKIGSDPNGTPDAIAMDTIGRMSHDRPIRKLAAILRLADELADDRTRSNKLDLEVLAENKSYRRQSEIHHVYAQRLHPPAIDHQTRTIQLTFELLMEHVVAKYYKRGKGRYLLDEIFERTLKTHREQIYCSRFMSPDILLDRVAVEILVCTPKYQEVRARLDYTLEQAYPVYICKIADAVPSLHGVSGHGLAGTIDEIMEARYDGSPVDLNPILSTAEYES